MIDVNIHPTKQDIKLSKMDLLYSLILNTLKNTLQKNLLIPEAVGRMSSNSLVKQHLEEIVAQDEDRNLFSVSENQQEELNFHEEIVPIHELEEEKNPEIKRLHLTPLCQIHRYRNRRV